MALKSPHRNWRLETINPVDVRAVGLDQLLIRLWLRVLFENRPLLARPNALQKIAELAHEIERRSNESFRGFEDAEGAAETWLRADLVTTLRRTPETFTVARPVHALATRIRSVDRQTDDSSASLAIYSWLDHVDRELLSDLREFINVDVEEEEVDLATYALALLGNEQPPDIVRSDSPREIPRPVCLGQAKTYAEDVRRLLAYRVSIPRAALVDHLRRLTGFHLGIYFLRLFRAVVEVEQTGDRSCEACREGRIPASETCPYRLETLADCGEDARSRVAKLAESSWSIQEDYLARYIRSHLALKKLHEFAEHLAKNRPAEAVPFSTLSEIAAVEHAVRPELIDLFFDQWIEQLVAGSGSEEEAARVGELEREYRSMGLSPFRVYVALLAHSSERRWFNYHRYLLDSLFAKNSSDGMLRQPLGGKRRRRVALGAALLETLALIAVVDESENGYFTRPLRVDQLIERLEKRYDLLVGRPPQDLAADLEANREVAGNVDRFKARLRETGLFTDLSDAFLAQLVRPRHSLASR
jgi:hypothetical protein